MIRVILFIGWSLLLMTQSVQAELWSGILDPARATNWTTAGVTGGIPTNYTQCTNTACNTVTSAGASSTGAQINAAISGAPASSIVNLPAGSYSVNQGLLFARSNVILRGAGPNATLLTFSDSDGCTGTWDANICIRGSDLGYYAADPTLQKTIKSWTTHFTQGDTVITLNNVTGLTVGRWIVLDQTDESSCADSDTICVCHTDNVCQDEGGGTFIRTGRGYFQFTKVTAINGNDVTISPGLLGPFWSSGKTPQAWWGTADSQVHGVGIENLSIDPGSSNPGNSLISIIFAYDCWVKNVRLLYAPVPSAWINVLWSIHVTIRDSYGFGSSQETSTSLHYGVATNYTQHILVENNIFQRRTSAIVSNSDVASVYAYNYAINAKYATAGFMQGSNYNHEVGSYYILHEGNRAIGIRADQIHGTSNMNTMFRNYSVGWETGMTINTSPFVLYGYNRFWHAIGNVLGDNSHQSTYESISNITGIIYAIGVNGITTGGSDDTHVRSTLMRWGNYDTVRDAVSWCGNSSNTGWSTTCGSTSEVPTGIANLPNAVPATETLPNSFYVSSKPTFFGSHTWPPIGPEVTGGDITGLGGHAYRIPAEICFTDVMGGSFGDTTPRTFNADDCYATSTFTRHSVISGRSGFSGSIKTR